MKHGLKTMFPSPSKPVVGRSSVIIRKSAEEVFRFIGEDFFENYPKWSPEVKNLRALSDGPVRVGTLARQVRVDFGYRSESDFRVLEFQKYQRFVWAGLGHVGDVLRMSAFRCVYDLKAAPFSESCTRVDFTFEIPELDFVMRPFERLVRVVIQKGAAHSLWNIKGLIERGKARCFFSVPPRRLACIASP